MDNQSYILALGFFDGVHLGHGALLEACRQMADRAGIRAGAVTFSVHPDALVLGSPPPLLTGSGDRERLMKEYYTMDEVFFLPFDRALMGMPWQEFFRLLREKYHAAGLVCGEDFRFGAGGVGNGDLLRQICRENGMECTVIPCRKLDGTVISSTHIRTLLSAGDVENANRFLGHPHRVTGTVVPGSQIGRRLGFPTANVQTDPGLLPLPHGVYACRIRIGGETHPAAVNVGTRPTVGGTGVTTEAWIPEYTGDLYGKTVTLEFFRFLRPEKKFDSERALREEIRKNAEETVKILEKK